MAEETTSGAVGQSPGGGTADVAQATTAPPQPEGTAPAVQEQTISPPGLTDEQIEGLLGRKDVQARIYQQAQSMADQRAHQERLRQQAEAEQRRVEGLDDEEYGSLVRRQQQSLAAAQQVAMGAVARTLVEMQDKTLSVITNKKVREEMAAKSSEFKTYPEFVQACVNAEAEYQVGQQLTQREKELRAVITKELQAEQADTLVPQLGRGTPAARVDMSKMSSDQLIAEGFQEKLRDKRRAGR